MEQGVLKTKELIEGSVKPKEYNKEYKEFERFLTKLVWRETLSLVF